MQTRFWTKVKMNIKNIYTTKGESLEEELIEELVAKGSFRLERIVSKGHRTPEGEWYDQERDEWVVLLKGRAMLKIEGRDDMPTMKPGDCIHLPANLRHRVEWTDPGKETVWLALHY